LCLLQTFRLATHPSAIDKAEQLYSHPARLKPYCQEQTSSVSGWSQPVDATLHLKAERWSVTMYQGFRRGLCLGHGDGDIGSLAARESRSSDLAGVWKPLSFQTTAKRLGLELSPSVLARTDEVIE
jgi:hypothetical protein